MKQLAYYLNRSRASSFTSLIDQLLSNYVEVIVSAIAFILWLAYLPTVDIRNTTDLGIASALPIPIYATMLLVIAAFASAIARPKVRDLNLGLILLITIVMLYGITALIEQEPRFAINYVHEGFSDYIRRTGSLATGLDARFSWPGFFIYGALLPEIIGIPSTLTFAAWASVIFNVLYCFPLYMILSSMTSDRRLIWLALWFFCLGNWVGQDYWAPQAMNYFMFLVIMGVLLKFFRAAPQYEFIQRLSKRWQRSGLIARLMQAVHVRVRHLEPELVEVSSGQRVGLALLLVVVMFFVSSSHQLTPFLVVVATAALVFLNQIKLRTFLAIALILTALWISYMTVSFLSGNITGLLSDVGSVSSVVSANVGSRIKGSSEHQIIVFIRVVMTVAIGIMGAFGVIRRLFNGTVDLIPIALGIVPFTMLAFQSYGGELILRSYFFALPFMAFLAAALFFARPANTRRLPYAVALSVVGVILLAGFFLARYGNERMDYVTPEELQGIDYVYANAPAGSALIIISPNLPLRYEKTEQYIYLPGLEEFYLAEVSGVRQLSQEQSGHKTYVIITRTQKAYAELFYGLEPGWGDRLEQQLTAAPDFKLRFQNRDASIFQYIASGRGTQ